MLAPNKEHKKGFTEVLIVGFQNHKSLKDDRPSENSVAKDGRTGGSEPCGKGTCQMCDHIITTNTFRTKVCGEVFKLQSEPLNSNLEKVVYLLRCKLCDDTLYVGKAKTNFHV